MKVPLILLAAYLIGSIPSGYIVFRRGLRKDIRGLGSRSTGATNVLRLAGWRYALPVLVADVLKAAVPVGLILKFSGDRRLAVAAALAIAVGQCFPVFIKFRGGKGVSTAMGAYAILSPPLFAAGLVVFGGVIAATRLVSLGSLLGTLSVPLLAFLWKADAELGILGAAVFVLVAFRHSDNIRRLVAGRERKLGEKKEPETQ
jgi:acyl phosphate:glycerol-3-phosphate acyltransferase